MRIDDLINKITCADCMDILKQLPDKCIDLVLTDPPYGTTACKWDSIIPFKEMWKELERIRKEDCAVVLFGQEPFSSLLRVSNLDNYKYDWIWEKQKAANFMSMKYQPAKYHELISVFYQHNYYPIMWQAEHKDTRKTVNNPTTNKVKFIVLSANGKIIKNTNASAVPVIINGILRPIGVLTLSDSAPKIGSKNNANTLSAAIIAPVTVSPKPKVFFKISGITLSYICQKALIVKNAIPIKTVLL